MLIFSSRCLLHPALFLVRALEELRPAFFWIQRSKSTPPMPPSTRSKGCQQAPEPATWAMMAVGFGLVGGPMRYRRGVPRGAVA